MHKFVWFQAMESKMQLSQEFGKKRNERPLQSYMNPNCIIVIPIMYILNRNFCEILSTRNWDVLIPKVPEKVSLKHHLLSDFHQM